MNPPPRTPSRLDSGLLPAAARIVVPLQCVFAAYLLLRGHNLPGGGFIGGLVLASALVLRLMVHPERLPRMDPVGLVGAGILCAVGAAAAPMLAGEPFFQAMWAGGIHVPGLGEIKLGTPLLFDLGVFITVTGVGAKMLSVLLSKNDADARKNR